MSKATKKAKHKARNAPKVRRGAHCLKGFTPNPAFGMVGPELVDAAFDMPLLNVMRRSGLTDALKKIVFSGAELDIEVDAIGGDAELRAAVGRIPPEAFAMTPAKCGQCGAAYSAEWIGTSCSVCDGAIESPGPQAAQDTEV
jgi:hypothetical protein